MKTSRAKSCFRATLILALLLGVLVPAEASLGGGTVAITCNIHLDDFPAGVWPYHANSDDCDADFEQPDGFPEPPNADFPEDPFDGVAEGEILGRTNNSTPFVWSATGPKLFRAFPVHYTEVCVGVEPFPLEGFAHGEFKVDGDYVTPINLGGEDLIGTYDLVRIGLVALVELGVDTPEKTGYLGIDANEDGDVVDGLDWDADDGHATAIFIPRKDRPHAGVNNQCPADLDVDDLDASIVAWATVTGS